MNLYEYGDTLQALIDQAQAMIDEGQDPNSDAVQAVLRQMVGAESDWKQKAGRVGLYIRQCHAEAEMIKAEAKRLIERAQAHVKRADSLTELLKTQMIATGTNEINDVLCPIKLRINPWSVTVDNAEHLPPQYQRAKVEADKKALLKDREQLQAIAGVVFERSVSLKVG